jgi:hypothetical protein
MIIHGLKDSLTAISGKIEHLLENESGLCAERCEEMKNCLDHCDDLNGLIRGLLLKKQMRKITDDIEVVKLITINFPF